MRVVVTGGAGFIGRAVVGRLADRGDQVVALVRDPARAAHLKRDNVTLVVSDLSSVAAAGGADDGRGRASSTRPACTRSASRSRSDDRMWDANVGRDGARPRCSDRSSTCARIVYVSTVERLRRHAWQRRRRDLPARPERRGSSRTTTRPSTAPTRRPRSASPPARRSSSSSPSQVYGPNDHSLTSAQLDQAFHGKLRVRGPD